jgi:hypothetical protein
MKQTLVIFFLTLSLLNTGWASPAKPPVPVKQVKYFKSLTDVVNGLTAALEDNDKQTLVRMLGPPPQGLIIDLDVPQRAYLQQQLKLFHSFSNKSAEEVILVFGRDKIHLPVPLRMVNEGWYFNTTPTKTSAVDRAIWNNEFSAVHLAHAYIDAQRSYYRLGYGPRAKPQFAQRFRCTYGRRDGLFWEIEPGEKSSPLAFVMGKADAGGLILDPEISPPLIYNGYYYKILKAQGAAARGGARSYLIGDSMTEGFALIAWPAKWGTTGRRSFLINHDDNLYARDLGKDTVNIASSLAVFNPEKGWVPLKETE